MLKYTAKDNKSSSDLAQDIQDYTWFRNQTTHLKDLEFGFTVENTNDLYTIGDTTKNENGLRLKYSFEISNPIKT